MASFNIFRRGGSAISGILNVLGMAVAFAAFFIILVQVNYDLNFNKGIKDSEKVYALTSGSFVNAGKRALHFNRPIAEIILQSSPNIEYGGIMGMLNWSDINYNIGTDEAVKTISAKTASMSGTAFKALGFEAVSGSLDDIIDYTTLAVSESVAERFGLEVGMNLTIDGNSDVRIVKAIFKDMPQNSHFKNLEFISNMGEESIDNFSEWSYSYFIKVHDPSQIRQMEESLKEVTSAYYMDKFFSAIPSAEEMGMLQEELDNAINKLLERAQVKFAPLDDLYFSDEIDMQAEKGNRTTTVVLLIVAILIVGIAFINYINFFFAQIPERIRTVNTKKVLGCTRRELITSTVAESLTLITFALAVAFTFVILFNISQMTHLIAADCSFDANVGVAVWTVVIAVLIAIISSLYPAFYITSFEPALVLKGSFGGSRRGKALRYALIGLQFVISICLIICSSFISIQRRYMISFDMGFDKEQLLYVHAGNLIGQNAEAVEERLKADPQITDVTWANGNLLASERMGWGRDWNGQMISFQCYPVAYDFPEFMGIGITEGRSFLKEDDNSENGVFIFNEAARKEFGFTLEDRVNGHKDEAGIVGFCEDFSFMTLKEEVRPFALYVYGKDPWWYPSTAFIRVAAGADYQSVMKHIGTVLSEWEPSLSADSWDVHFFDENLNATYRKEQSLSQLISLFTLIAIIISLMGVFGLVMFETQYRRREIALRRVNGASVEDILKMFSSKFVKIVLVCFVVAAPVSWVIVDRYLSTFAHRCPMYWWVFILALVAVMTVTVSVVVIRSWRAATADPAEALKSE